MLFPDPFLKNQNEVYLWINSLKFYIAFFIVCQVEDYHNILKLSCGPLAFTLYKALLKNKKRSGISFPTTFSAWFLKKNISRVKFYYQTKIHCLVAFTLLDIAQYVYCNCLLTRLWRHEFWNQPYLSSQPVFSTRPKSQHKNLDVLDTKRAFKMK